MTDSMGVYYSSFASLSRLAQQELSKWQQDRKRWETTLPVMSWMSQFLTLTPTAEDQAHFASTDGRHLYFSPTLSATLTEEERVFLQAHLIWHCVAGHLAAPLVASPKRWHLACDHEINSLLLELGVSLPSKALIFPICVGLEAIQVYEWLSAHPRLDDEGSMDIHPAALWTHDLACLPDLSLIALWRRRAHVAVRESPALPARVADFCATR